MFKVVAFAAVLLLFGVFAQAQIFYEPAQPQYQIGGSAQTFFYAGRDARIIEYARRVDSRYSRANWTNGTRTAGNAVPRIPVSPTIAIYDDAFPCRDLSQDGWTSGDAVNQSNARIALYYRRCDSPPPGAPGVWIVAADGSAVQVEPPRTAPPPDDNNNVILPRGTIQIIPLHPKPAPLQTASAARA